MEKFGPRLIKEKSYDLNNYGRPTLQDFTKLRDSICELNYWGPNAKLDTHTHTQIRESRSML